MSDSKSYQTKPVNLHFYRESTSPLIIRHEYDSDEKKQKKFPLKNSKFNLNDADSENLSHYSGEIKFKKSQNVDVCYNIYNLNDIFNRGLKILKNKKSYGNKSEGQLNLIVVDDEVLARKSNIRTLIKVANKLKININIFEVEDGVECLFAMYKLIKWGLNIDIIFSDQTMNYMNGTECASLIEQIFLKKTKIYTPFYLVTAYGNTGIEINGNIKEVLAKPLSEKCIERILIFVNT